MPNTSHVNRREWNKKIMDSSSEVESGSGKGKDMRMEKRMKRLERILEERFLRKRKHRSKYTSPMLRLGFFCHSRFTVN